MTNLSVFSRHKKKYPYETIANGHSSQQLPRHISAPSTQSHRGIANFDKHHCIYQPRVCAIDACKSQQTSVTTDLSKYQLNDRVAIEKHRRNLIANLKYRLQIAQAKGNSQLIDILQDEYRQLETSH